MTSILHALFRLTNGRALAMLDRVPGPVPIALLGNGHQLVGRDLHTLLEAWRAEHGDLFRFFLFSRPSLVTAKPEHVVRILVDRPDEWIKNVPRGATRPVGGESVFRSEGGADWKRKRSAHPFEKDWVLASYDTMLPALRRLISERLARREGETLDLYQEILRATFDAFALIVLGEILPPEAFREHEVLLREVGRRGALPVPFSPSPIFWWRRRSWLARIERRLARGSLGPGATDLVSMLAKGKVDLRSTQVRDELGNVFAAGMKNAAIAAAATVFLVAKHPDVAARLRAELDGARWKSDRAALITLPYLDRVAKETLRLYPSVAGFVREVAPGRTVELDGVTLPPRTQVFLISWVMHRHPGIWPEPTRFDPDRFLEAPRPGSYFPFGLGDRVCVGRDWTLLVAKAIASEIVARWEIDLDPAATFDTTLVSVLTVPRAGVPAKLRLRDRAARGGEEAAA